MNTREVECLRMAIEHLSRVMGNPAVQVNLRLDQTIESQTVALAVNRLALAMTEPVPMMLFCPKCGKQHVDKPDVANGWLNPPHATHTCAYCKTLWRPSNRNTAGVSLIKVEEEKHAARIAASFPTCFPPDVASDAMIAAGRAITGSHAAASMVWERMVQAWREEQT